jgi:hypothetical protein
LRSPPATFAFDEAAPLPSLKRLGILPDVEIYSTTRLLYASHRIGCEDELDASFGEASVNELGV